MTEADRAGAGCEDLPGAPCLCGSDCQPTVLAYRWVSDFLVHLKTSSLEKKEELVWLSWVWSSFTFAHCSDEDGGGFFLGLISL